MMKNILLNYIMSKYRKSLVVISLIIGLIVTIRFYFFMLKDNFYFPMLFLCLSIPIPFIVVIYNTPALGAPAVNENSSDLDIFLRYFALLGTLLPFVFSIYFTFYPEKFFE